MSEFFGDGASRTLSAGARSFVNVVWQRGAPPLDSELNLVGQISAEIQRSFVTSTTPSGWVARGASHEDDFEFDPQASNLFWFGSGSDCMWALVNGWAIPVTGTRSSDKRNAIHLPPPRSDVSESDVNFVFLEVWQAAVSPFGEENKPEQHLLYKYGNVEYGGVNVENDLVDPAIMMETTKRVQLQYRIRVVRDVDPSQYLQGFGPSIRAQAGLSAPLSSVDPAYQFKNMGEELGDPGLWRAGTGNGEADPLNTVDGYVYAVPICFVFRRTSKNWSLLQQHGATDRNPNMIDRSEATVLPTVKITEALDSETLAIEVDTTQGATTFPTRNGLIQLGKEIVRYDSYLGTTITLLARGERGTYATKHEVGTEVSFVTGHPLGLFSDQIVAQDVLDLRHIVTGMSDYSSLLQRNFSRLVQGELATTWKKSHAMVKGRQHFQVDYVGAANNAPDYSIGSDRPDGFRKVFSDAAALQANNILVLGDGATSRPDVFTLNPEATVYRREDDEWSLNDTVIIPLEQFRTSIPMPSPSNRKVRFVHPFEYDESTHCPLKIWFGDYDASVNSYRSRGVRTLKSEMIGQNPDYMVLGSVAEVEGVLTQGVGKVRPPLDDTLELRNNNNIVQYSPQEIDHLVEMGAWVLLTSTSPGASSETNLVGAYRIVGGDGNGNLRVKTALGVNPSFDQETKERKWSIRLPQCTEQDEEVAITLVRNPGDNGSVVGGVQMFVSYDLLYHPSRGLSRVPQRSLYVENVAGTDENYVREKTFRNVATSTQASVRRSAVTSMAKFPHHHNRRGGDTVWADAYVDRGSKTLVYQPLRNANITLDIQNNPSESLTDVTNIFDTGAGAVDASVVLPAYIKPPLGRIDLPFVRERSSSNPAGYGINFLFASSTGSRNESLVSSRIVFVYAPSIATEDQFGEYINLAGAGANINALVCRLYNKDGIKGIELPPHYGISRLFAAHFLSEYDGVSVLDAANFRVPSGVERLNLLRESDEGTFLHITEENTFVIPQEVLDPKYISLEDYGPCPPPGSNVSEQEIIFEAAAFFFDDWTSDFTRFYKRRQTSLGATHSIFINAPALAGDSVFVVSTRTPYQGSIYGTMPVSGDDNDALEFIDYVPKRQTEQVVNILDLLEPLGAAAREENEAELEVLATLPFATTLGTGIISGEVVSGSYTDIGYVDLGSYPYTDIRVEERTVLSRAHPSTPGGQDVAPPLAEALGGITERLPLGMIGGDYLFLGEGVGTGYQRFWNPPAGSDTVLDTNGSYVPLGHGKVVFSDGTSSLRYKNDVALYRTYRGGVVKHSNKGPIAITGGRAVKDLSYIRDVDLKHLKMHGAVLFGIALLVRNTKEEATRNNVVTSYGGEIQMLVLTGITLGKELDLTGDLQKEFVDLLIKMHPRGEGEGYCAADRFRIGGRPLTKV